MSRRIDLTGRRFGRLVVMGPRGKSKGGHSLWLCHCDCGNDSLVIVGNLLRGNSTTCGCGNREATSRSNTTHGMRRVPGYCSWYQLMERCFNRNALGYLNYGGRGITVCEAWRDVARFLSDMGARPQLGMTIDRIDNDGNYSCGTCPECLANGWKMNCRWATRAEQLRNTRRTRYFEIGGRRMCLKDWCREIGISPNTVRYRLDKRCMSIEQALGISDGKCVSVN